MIVMNDNSTILLLALASVVNYNRKCVVLQFGASLTVINNAARVICYAPNIYIIQATGANNRVDNKGVKVKHT